MTRLLTRALWCSWRHGLRWNRPTINLAASNTITRRHCRFCDDVPIGWRVY